MHEPFLRHERTYLSQCECKITSISQPKMKSTIGNVRLLKATLTLGIITVQSFPVCLVMYFGMKQALMYLCKSPLCCCCVTLSVNGSGQMSSL
jgi:hypothetical protein